MAERKKQKNTLKARNTASIGRNEEIKRKKPATIKKSSPMKPQEAEFDKTTTFELPQIDGPAEVQVSVTVVSGTGKISENLVKQTKKDSTADKRQMMDLPNAADKESSGEVGLQKLLSKIESGMEGDLTVPIDKV